MIGGTSIADYACLVISARKGEFEAGFMRNGQTKEHVQLTKLLGVHKLIVLVNKMDACKWDEERYNEIQNGISPFLE